MVLPKGHTAESFSSFISRLTAIVGESNMMVKPEQLTPYRKIMVPSDIENHAPCAAVAAESVEQIQSILSLCNELLVPVWPISTGRNFGYGTATPAMRGTMVLDLRRMNNILSYDERLGVIEIEPGVTYRQLQDFLRSKGSKHWMDVPGSGAVTGPMGQTLERGIGYTPYGDHFNNSCGYEVVLADGSILRTGYGSIPGSKAWHYSKHGMGPSLDGLFTQSNYGVVTKIGVWLMPAPEVYKPFLIATSDHDAIGEMIDRLQPLTMKNVIKNRPILGLSLYEIAQRFRKKDVFDGEGGVTDEWLSEFTEKHRMPIWAGGAALYGTKEQVEADWKEVKRAFRGSKFMLLTDLLLHEDPSWQHFKRVFSGNIDLDEFGVYNWIGGGGSVWFAATAPISGDFAEELVVLGKKIVRSYGFDFIPAFMVQQREMGFVCDILYDKTDPDQERRAHACYSELMDEFAKLGLGVYRTSIAFMDKAAEIQGEVRSDVNNRIKRALDPNGIIAPGKSGIFA